jgi:hypothetical protein
MQHDSQTHEPIPLIIGLEPNNELDKIVTELCRAHDILRRYTLVRRASSRRSIHQKGPPEIAAIAVSIVQTERVICALLNHYGEQLRAYLAPYVSAGIPSTRTSNEEVDRWFVAHCVFNTELATGEI